MAQRAIMPTHITIVIIAKAMSRKENRKNISDTNRYASLFINEE